MEEHRRIALLYGSGGTDPSRRFAGRPLDERALALAAAAGLRASFVAEAPQAEARRAHPIPSGQAIAPGALLPAPRTDGGAVILLRCDVATVAGALRALLAEQWSRGAVARDDSGRVAIVRLPASALRGAAPASLEAGASGLPAVAPDGRCDGHPVLSLAAADGGPAGDARMRELEAMLVADLDNPRDGAFDRLLNRHLSRRITPRLLRLPVTPNEVTIASLFVGVLAAIALAGPGRWWPLVGALLVQATAVLDCVDGEIARAKVLESDWGELLDITSDSLIHVLAFLGIAWHAWPQLGPRTALVLGALFATGGLASFAVVTRAERTESAWKPLDTPASRLLGGMLATLTTRDLSVLILAAVAAGVQAQLLVGAAVGAHAFWLLALGLHAGLVRRAGGGGGGPWKGSRASRRG